MANDSTWNAPPLSQNHDSQANAAVELKTDLPDSLSINTTMMPRITNVMDFQLNEVLTRLFRIDVIGKLVRRWSQVCPISPVPWSLLEEILLSVESVASHLSQNPAEAHNVATGIKDATRQPLVVPPSTLPTEFSKLLTGKNLRLESIGIILSIASNAALGLLESDVVFSSLALNMQDRQSFVEDMLSASDTCIAFCEQYFGVHDAIVWLRYENFLLTLNSCGYASKYK